MTATSLMALNSNWLGNPSVSTQVDVTRLGDTAGKYQMGQVTVTPTIAYDYPWWSNTCYYPVYHTSPARPIKLTMSEVERLRRAAKADDKLKAILQKFTGQIEITVDFE
jgi:hypothetical protein